MEGKYRALRVPIALLQQSVYDRGRRLEKWKPLPPKVVTVTPYIYRDAGRVISRSTTGVAYDPINTLFVDMPYLRKHFYLTDGISKLQCRYCGEAVISQADRYVHAQSCYVSNSKVIDRLMEMKECCICKGPLDRHTAIRDFDFTPICSEDCLMCWDYCEPDSYAMALLFYKEDQNAKYRNGAGRETD